MHLEDLCPQKIGIPNCPPIQDSQHYTIWGVKRRFCCFPIMGKTFRKAAGTKTKQCPVPRTMVPDAGCVRPNPSPLAICFLQLLPQADLVTATVQACLPRGPIQVLHSRDQWPKHRWLSGHSWRKAYWQTSQPTSTDKAWIRSIVKLCGETCWLRRL